MTPSSKRLVLAAGAVAGLLLVAAVAWLVLGGVRGTRFRGDTAGASVLLITVDTLRADHVGAYGSAEARTPVIDGLTGDEKPPMANFREAPISTG